MKEDMIIDFSNKSIISVAEINEFIKNSYREFLINKDIIPDTILIKFDQDIDRIDELFYSYLLLFTQDFPDTQIDLLFDNKNCAAYQIAVQQIYFINTYRIKNKIRLNKETPFVRVSDFKEFFPPLLIKENIDWFGINAVDRDSGEIKPGDANTRLTSLIEETCSDIIRDIQNDGCESHIEQIAERLYAKKKPFVAYILYLYKDLGIFDYYVNKKFAKDITLKDEIKHQDIYNTLDLDKKSIIEVFLLRMLIDKLSAKQKKDIQYLKTATEQVYKTVFALHELAKNILEHTGKGFGVISGRVHKKNTLSDIKDSHANLLFEKWISSQDEREYFLDINVIDSGTVGIRKSYIANLRKIKGDPKAEDGIKEDIKFLEQDNCLFSHFFDYENIKLLHQVYRANARLGLLIFSEFVLNQRNGLIRVSSTRVNDHTSTSEYIDFSINRSFDCGNNRSIDYTGFIELGTNYNFIIPISEKHTTIPLKREESSDLTPSTSILMELFRLSDKIRKKSIATNESNKYGKIEAIKNQIDAKNGEVILIDADEEGSGLHNSSDWIRFLANMQIISSIPVIVYNMDYNLYSEIININRLFEDSQIGFWNDERNLLFYLKQSSGYEFDESLGNHRGELSLWFCSVMSGKKYNSFLLLNKAISRYHHNLFSIEESQIENPNEELSKKGSVFFTQDGKLLNCELLVKRDDKITLFEESVKSLLELKICTLSNNVKLSNNKDRFFHKFKGYKISDAHFRLGSKIHIDDFYYAKRMFYNSFYANRFAFLLATRIKMILGNEKNKEVTLIGYSHYSELLVSNTRRLLNELGHKKVNHDIVLDEGKVQKNVNDIKENIIVIIPISSTFSTSHKVRRILDDVMSERGKLQFINDTDISILLVADKRFDSPDNRNFKDIQIFNDFGWDGEIPNLSKRIKVGNSFQEYFIYLPTKWQLIDECELCFPKNPSDEKCLLETGASSITPESIFGFPIIHHQSETNQARFNELSFYRQNNDGIRYYTLHKHLVKEKLHFKQYVRVGSFLYDENNNTKIKEWLISLRNDKEYLNKNIVIVTPSQNAKAGFANLVNQYVFDETATVLLYNATDDALQNFIYFNSSFFSDAYLIFVDDVIHSAQTFQKINNLIKSVVCVDVKQRRVDKCICLIDRLSFFDRQNLLGNLSKKEAQINAFIELNIPPLTINDYEFPEVVKERLFVDLAKKSVTDIMKIHFYELSKKVAPQDLDNYANKYLEQTHTKDLFHFLVYHVLFELFEITKIAEDLEYKHILIISKLAVKNYEQAMLDILTFVENNRSIADFLKTKEGELYKEEIKTKVLYICSTPPFSDYKDIREFAFWGVRKELQEFVTNFETNKTNCDYFQRQIHGHVPTVTAPFAYTKYQAFKLYLRLGVELKMNYVFSEEMLCAIQILLTHWNKEEQRYKVERKESTDTQFRFEGDVIENIVVEDTKKVSPIGFITYYTGLIEQIICKDEPKSWQLLKNIADILHCKDSSPDYDFRLRKKFDNLFINLLRKLVLENTFIFNTFHECFYNDKKDEIDQYNFEKDTHFELYKILQSYEGQTMRFQTLKKMVEEDDVRLKKAFYRTMYLKTILKNEFSQLNTKGNIKDKVNVILKFMCEILDIAPNSCNGGAFFTVRYKNTDGKQSNIKEDDLFKITEYHSEDDTKIDNDVTNENSIVFTLYRGINEKGSRKQKSIIELLYDDKKTYSSTVCTDSQNKNIDIDLKIELHGQNRYRNLLFIRVSDIGYNKKNKQITVNPLAVICFYRCKIDKSCPQALNCNKSIRRIDPKRLRLLLLLKEDLSKFIKYQINDGFRAYVEMSIRSEMFGNIEHSNNIYFKNSAQRINEIEEKVARSKLQKALFLISSRYRLQKAYYNFLVMNKDIREVLDYCEIKPTNHKPSDLVDLFIEYFTNLHKDSSRLSENLKINFINKIDSIDCLYSSYEGVFSEILFEVALNIEKHIKNEIEIELDKLTTLEIIIREERIDENNYLTIQNNLAKDNATYKIHLNNERSTHGLGVINKYSKLIFKQEIKCFFIDSNIDNDLIFKICIPINKI